jgi:acyl carrier protein
LTPETLLEGIELDSLAVHELIFALEDELHFTANKVNEPFRTLGDVADYVDALIAERDTAPAPASK